MSDNRNTHLTVINGIGKSREKWLREVLHIQTLRDLSQMSADDLEAQVKAEGLTASRAQVENWIAQAKALVIDKPADHTHNWMPYASFVVEYEVLTLPSGDQQHRTIIHHMETDRGASWPGTVTGEIADWIKAEAGIDRPLSLSQVLKQQADLAPVVPSEDQTMQTLPAQQPVNDQQDDGVKIVQVKAFQPAASMLFAGHGRHGQPFLGSLKSGEPFALEAELALDSDLAAGKPRCVTQFYAYDTTSGTKLHLGNSEPQTLAEARVSPKALLPQASLARGLYRLRIYTTIESSPPRSSYVEVPFVQVN